ncbi:MAG: hypothetical protein Q8P59_06890 [Dehalococcoidia bacterium]|nr:hypothetical protein [Dehalococcoidia bacterium]
MKTPHLTVMEQSYHMELEHCHAHDLKAGTRKSSRQIIHRKSRRRDRQTIQKELDDWAADEWQEHLDQDNQGFWDDQDRDPFGDIPEWWARVKEVEYEDRYDYPLDPQDPKDLDGFRCPTCGKLDCLGECRDPLHCDPNAWRADSIDWDEEDSLHWDEAWCPSCESYHCDCTAEEPVCALCGEQGCCGDCMDKIYNDRYW